jgi:hypothetical protein
MPGQEKERARDRSEQHTTPNGQTRLSRHRLIHRAREHRSGKFAQFRPDSTAGRPQTEERGIDHGHDEEACAPCRRLVGGPRDGCERLSRTVHTDEHNAFGIHQSSSRHRLAAAQGPIACSAKDFRHQTAVEVNTHAYFMRTKTAVGLLSGAVPLLLASRTVLRDWGATKHEQSETLPGDELVPEPADVSTRAVSVHAPAEQVWPWLVQMGQDRGGMYSYTWLENLFGLHIHNADEIRAEWQRLSVGDVVRLVPAGALGLAEGLALPVEQIAPPQTLVLRVEPWHAVWSFHVRPDGPGTSRLISRSRAPEPHGLGRIAAELLEPITMLMTRKMLLGIKARAEHRPRSAS